MVGNAYGGSYVVAPKPGVQHVSYGHHSDITRIIVIFVVGIVLVFFLRLATMIPIESDGAWRIIVDIHLGLRRSDVFFIIRRRVPLFNLETPRQYSAACYMITFEGVPAVEIIEREEIWTTLHRGHNFVVIIVLRFGLAYFA
jgi:hypothetical protein